MPTTKRDLQALAYCRQCRRVVSGPRRLRRGLCGTCYQRWLDDQPGSLKRTPLERFWSKVTKGDHDECWEWTGSRTAKGYGQFTPRLDHVYAHRFAYELANGPIPDGLTIDHRCLNRGCVNPAHLEVVTLAENTKRAHRHQCPHCELKTTKPNLRRHMRSKHPEVTS